MSNKTEVINIDTEWGVIPITKDTPPYFIHRYTIFALVKEGQVVTRHGICAHWKHITCFTAPINLSRIWSLYKIGDLDPIVNDIYE